MPKKQICINGHDTSICGRDKYSNCKNCIKEWREAHKEELKQGQREHYQLNKDKILTRNRKYHKEHAEEIAAQTKGYREDNKESISNLKKEYYELHKDEINAYKHEWYELHKDEVKARTKKYRQDHPELYALLGLKYKTLRILRIVPWGQEGMKEFYLNMPNGCEGDHIIPLQGKLVSGLHVSWNLQYLTKLENNKKKNKCNLLEASDWYGKILEEAGLK